MVPRADVFHSFITGVSCGTGAAFLGSVLHLKLDLHGQTASSLQCHLCTAGNDLQEKGEDSNTNFLYFFIYLFILFVAP